MDFLLGFFVGFVWWEWLLFAACVILTGISLNKESGLGFLILMAIGGYFLFNVHLTVGMVVTYIVAGICWLLFKFNRHVHKTIAYYQDLQTNNNRYSKANVRTRIFQDADIDTVFFWFIAWPFSMAGFFCYDFMEMMYTKFVKMVSGHVDKMLEAAGFE